MRYLFAAILLGPALFCQSTFAQSMEESIRTVLDRQAADWNRGDVRAFMRGYDDSDTTLFVGARIERGYQHVLERYLSRYGTRDKMGRLTFSDIEVRPLGTEYALVIGAFHLARPAASGGNSDGIFTLTFQRKQAEWKIIADHTSEIAPAQ